MTTQMAPTPQIIELQIWFKIKIWVISGNLYTFLSILVFSLDEILQDTPSSKPFLFVVHLQLTALMLILSDLKQVYV